LRLNHTRPTAVAIGERRRPDPAGRPCYLRVDTVHQGDLDGVKGIYHINLVDEVTQWQVVGATPRISEAWLKPLLEALLEQFPFRIRGFHSDNGSEYINRVIAGMLNKLLIEQTKSRPRHSTDNGLVEAKNGAVIRKHMGFDHIASAHADAINEFYREQFNPYLNFHRPCGVPELVWDKKGATKRVYRWYAMPWEILRQLPGRPRISEKTSPWSNWSARLAPRAIPGLRWRCNRPKSGSSPASSGRKRHEYRAAEMPGCGRRGKPEAGFPRPPTSPWKSPGDFHIPAAPAATARESGNPNPGFPLSRACFTR
jgi:hypothetical protein